jgi:hypothetical protein
MRTTTLSATRVREPVKSDQAAYTLAGPTAVTLIHRGGKGTGAPAPLESYQLVKLNSTSQKHTQETISTSASSAKRVDRP